MAYPAYIREKARALRERNQMTIDELADCLGVPRTTVYYWIRDLPIPAQTPRRSLAQQAPATANRAKARRRREDAYFEGLREFDRLVADPTFRDFVTLYMPEGYRRCRNTVSLGNSDPAIARIACYWIRRLSKNKIGYAIHYHADQKPDALREFWGAELGVDPGAIRVQAKSNSNQLTGRKWRSRYGLMDVRVSDTMLRSRLQAWMDSLRRQWLDSGEHGA